jgi:hypothetical protein
MHFLSDFLLHNLTNVIFCPLASMYLRMFFEKYSLRHGELPSPIGTESETGRKQALEVV